MDAERMKKGLRTGFREGGELVRADLQALIETVYLPPGTPKWFRHSVLSCIQRYGFDFAVEGSSLDLTAIH
jgi:hypothetical protein